MIKRLRYDVRLLVKQKVTMKQRIRDLVSSINKFHDAGPTNITTEAKLKETRVEAEALNKQIKDLEDFKV
jgi:hypothetical protein